MNLLPAGNTKKGVMMEETKKISRSERQAARLAQLRTAIDERTKQAEKWSEYLKEINDAIADTDYETRRRLDHWFNMDHIDDDWRFDTGTDNFYRREFYEGTLLSLSNLVDRICECLA